MRKSLVLLLATGCLLGGWRYWAAAWANADSSRWQPVAVVSLSSYDKALDNIAMLGRSVGSPKLASQLVLLLKLCAIQGGLDSPSKARPYGAVVQTDGKSFSGYAFMPVGDPTSLGMAVDQMVGQYEELGGGTYKVTRAGQPVYATLTDGWVFLTLSADALADLPDNPGELLEGLNEQYDAALRIHVNKLFPDQRRHAVAWLRDAVESNADQADFEPDSVHAIRRQVTEMLVHPILDGLDDAETLSVGWSLDTSSRKFFTDLRITAREGSESHRLLETAREGEVLPVEWSVSVGQSAASLAKHGPTESIRLAAARVVTATESAAGDDCVKLSADLIPRGIGFRLEIQRGVIELLGRLRSPETETPAAAN